MKGPSSMLARVARVATLVRTLRPIRCGQAIAQLRHMLIGLPAPQREVGAFPTLVVESAQTAFLPPPAHVRGDPSRIEILATPFPFEERVDWNTRLHGPLFAYHLHQQEYLRLASFDPAARSLRLRDWIDSHDQGIGWDPHPISLRLLCWGRLLLTPGALGSDADLRDTMLGSMADQARTLVRGLEIRLQANHLLSNLIAVVWSGLLLEAEDASNWRAHAERLVRELDAQILPDGGHEERSPMYHSLLLENILDLLNLSLVVGSRAPDGLVAALSATASRMLSALEVMKHPDGRIALFADSGFDIAAEPAALLDYATRLGVSASREERRSALLLPQTGYLRFAVGSFDLIASVAGPSPAHQPGHAHCDALAFELSVDGKRLVTDTGLFEYLPGRRRDQARATASHATLEIDGREQAELWSAHRIGGRPDVALSAWDDSGSAEGTCRGWSRGAPLHRRLFRVDERRVEIVDRIEGRYSEIVSRLPLDPDWQVEFIDGDLRARIVAEDGLERVVRFELARDYSWVIEREPSYPSFGREVERPVLVGRAGRPAETTIRIRFER
ncbi:MAG: hypothetical protein GY910_11330 [bacterium]|nr:hypothetical protein [Deltaproteobacteria bacterium]MCP4905562.1 hypothetical protein [bacterium]